jgi:hypothetical protein
MVNNDFDLDDLNDDVVILSGLDSAIIGITESFGGGQNLLYSKDKVIEILMTRDGMTEEEAHEYYDYNIIGLYVNESNPIFLV